MEVQSTFKEIRYDVLNSDHENHHIVVNHSILNDNSQQELEIKDQGEMLNIVKGGSDPVNIEIDIAYQMARDVDVAPIEDKATSMESTNGVGLHLSMEEQMMHQSLEDLL
ncbi:hypothetical protein J1N35_018638 [Gossypium stocksii]|uniref:Uncharacterized protein n=1 Tax=Gossypium stocksii TaxID=47602 RepID=A0A9D3VPD6_9ROSI|nr:hypothetical protein J1N35_018638 [Gossypium stocksii]